MQFENTHTITSHMAGVKVVHFGFQLQALNSTKAKSYKRVTTI